MSRLNISLVLTDKYIKFAGSILLAEIKLKLVFGLALMALLSGIVLAQTRDVARMEVGLHITKTSIDSTIVDLYGGRATGLFQRLRRVLQC